MNFSAVNQYIASVKDLVKMLSKCYNYSILSNFCMPMEGKKNIKELESLYTKLKLSLITFKYMHLHVLFQITKRDYPQLDHWHHLVLKNIISKFAVINHKLKSIL